MKIRKKINVSYLWQSHSYLSGMQGRELNPPCSVVSLHVESKGVSVHVVVVMVWVKLLGTAEDAPSAPWGKINILISFGLDQWNSKKYDFPRGRSNYYDWNFVRPQSFHVTEVIKSFIISILIKCCFLQNVMPTS